MYTFEIEELLTKVSVLKLKETMKEHRTLQPLATISSLRKKVEIYKKRKYKHKRIVFDKNTLQLRFLKI